MDSSQRAQEIRRLLSRELAPEQLEIVDKSALHAGHQQADGGGHFRVTVVAEDFRGLLPLAAHRLVYAALGEMMEAEIHALELETFTPQQWAEREASS